MEDLAVGNIEYNRPIVVLLLRSRLKFDTKRLTRVDRNIWIARNCATSL